MPSYFRHLAEKPKMAEALWGAIRELRMAGLSAADLPPRAFERPAKRAELAARLAVYETHPATQRLADTAAVYREALLHADVSTVRPEDLWTELPGVIWAPLERRSAGGCAVPCLVPEIARFARELAGHLPGRRRPNPTSATSMPPPARQSAPTASRVDHVPA